MIPRSTLTSAAFWDQAVCLDCGALADAETDGPPSICPECGSAAILPARLIKAAGEFLEEIDRDGSDPLGAARTRALAS